MRSPTLNNDSWISWLSSLPTSTQNKFIDGLPDDELLALSRSWLFQARPDQLPPPGNWKHWLITAGRGWGKSRCGVERVDMIARTKPGSRIALLGQSASACRDVIIEGQSGILSLDRDDPPIYEPSKRRVTWSNGSIATAFSSEKSSQLRGPQFTAGYVDELASFRDWDAFDQLQFGLRLGDSPRCVITTTPRPLLRLKRLADAETTHVTRGRTADNEANLAPEFIEAIYNRYGNSTLGRQELEGELLSELPGALFLRKDIEVNRVDKAPSLRRIVVGVDPAVTSSDEADESGIVVAGLGDNGHLFILDDISFRGTPDAVCRRAIEAYKFHSADSIVFESNQGGETWKTITGQLDRTVAIKLVHASRSKHARAEPVASRVEQGRVHFVGVWPDLEDQLTNYVPGLTSKSPDRLDAFVWACTELDLLPNVDIVFNADDGYRGSSWI